MGTTVITNDFGKNFGKAIASAAGSVPPIIKGIAVGLLRGIVMDTPVDTGRLRGNWQTSAGAPIYTTTDREDKNGAAVTQEIVKNTDPLGVTYMTNNLPYAKRRNDEGGALWNRKKGQKRPEGVPAVSVGTGVNAGFVEKNFARIERNVKEAIGNAKG